MKEMAKKYYALEVEDVEKLVSDMAGREVKVGEMDVTLIDCAPCGPMLDGNYSKLGMVCEIYVDDEEIMDGDYNGPLDEYLDGIGEAFVSEDYIFAFDTALFSSYARECDSSD